MIIKKYYGNTIGEARKKAQSQLGNNFIILETLSEDGGQPSCITVMVDDDVSRNNGIRTSTNVQSSSKDKNVSFTRSNTGVKKPLHYLKNVFNETPFIQEGSENTKEKRKHLSKDEKDHSNNHENKVPDQKSYETLSKRQHSLFHYETASEAMEQSPNIPDNSAASKYHHEIRSLKKQLNKLEAKISESVILANIDFVSHPSFQQLLKAGIPAITIASWYKNIMDEGYTPENNPKAFLLQLGKQLRSNLPSKPPSNPVKNLVFVGNSGSGKTHLIMGLATNKTIFKNLDIAIINVHLPHHPNKYTVLEPFCRDRNLPFYSVSNGADLTKLNSELQEYDHVLIDTPSVALFDENAIDSYWKLRQILASITPMEIHMVVNANSQSILNKMPNSNPVQPDFIDVTHLDENDKWGQLIPFVHPYNCSLRYVSQGPAKIEKFEPASFVETILYRS
jgi:flagellar biosynthesis GTPase FlhF